VRIEIRGIIEGVSLMRHIKPVICVVIVIAILLGVLAWTGNYFYNVAIMRSEKDFLHNSQALKSTYDTLETYKSEDASSLGSLSWAKDLGAESWSITPFDGLKLSAIYIPAAKPTSKVVILAHGYSANNLSMGEYARFYYQKLGYNVLLPDARGHGTSEGNYIGFGWPERKDYLLWIQKVLDVVGDNSQIVLHGVSMGGATVMMVSGEELPSAVKAIIEDCGYTSVDKELAWQLKRLYNLPPFPLMNVTSLITRIRAGYSFYEASALRQVQKSKTPMLFIHGDQDTFVPFGMVKELYAACNAEKELYVVKGAGHGTAYYMNPAAYEQKVTEFIGRFIK
jgi:fermentation-respiration switch protein FrsA (DUF1100 family)